MVSWLYRWRDLYTQSLTIAAFSSYDSYGKPTYGSAVSYVARVVGKRRLVVNAAGQEVVSDWTAYLYSNTTVDPRSKVTLSTGDVGSTATLATNPPILSVERTPDENGMLYTALFF